MTAPELAVFSDFWEALCFSPPLARSRGIFFMVGWPRKPPFHCVPNADFQIVARLPAENAHREGSDCLQRRDMLVAGLCCFELDFARDLHRFADHVGELAHACAAARADVVHRAARRGRAYQRQPIPSAISSTSLKSRTCSPWVSRAGCPPTPSIDQVRQEPMNVLVSPEDVERPQVDERHPIDAIERGERVVQLRLGLRIIERRSHGRTSASCSPEASTQALLVCTNRGPQRLRAR